MSISTRSYDHGTSATPLIIGTIGDALDKAAERWPDREAVVMRDQAIRLTFAELRREVDRLAAGLIALSLRSGDRIGIWSRIPAISAPWTKTATSRLLGAAGT